MKYDYANILSPSQKAEPKFEFELFGVKVFSHPDIPDSAIGMFDPAYVSSESAIALLRAEQTKEENENTDKA